MFGLAMHHSPAVGESTDESFALPPPSGDAAHVDEIECRIRAMRAQEDGPYRCGDYLGRFRSRQRRADPPPADGSASTKRGPVDAQCRAKMVAWSYQVADFCDFNREVVAVASDLLDRYLDAADDADVTLRSRQLYQLASLTSLYTAVKITEPAVMEPAIVAGLSRGACAESDIATLEFTMLNALRWRVNPPTSAAFLRHYLSLLPPSALADSSVRSELYNRAIFLSELAVHDYDLAVVRPSIVAYAALLNSVEDTAAAEEGAGSTFTESDRLMFLRAVARVLGLGRSCLAEIARARERLFICASRYAARSESTPPPPAPASAPSAADAEGPKSAVEAAAAAASPTSVSGWGQPPGRGTSDDSPRCVSRESSARRVADGAEASS